MKTIEVTDEQYEAWKRGESIRRPKWEPKGGNYFINAHGCVHPAENLLVSAASFGMEYPTFELAERARDFMRPYHRLVAYAMEHWPDYRPPQSADEAVYFPHLRPSTAEWRVCAYAVGRAPWIPYGPLDQVEALTEKLNSGEVVL